jgi:hypothetical protein
MLPICPALTASGLIIVKVLLPDILFLFFSGGKANSKKVFKVYEFYFQILMTSKFYLSYLLIIFVLIHQLAIENRLENPYLAK